MSYEFKKLSEVQALTEVPEGAKVLAEMNGQIVRVPGSRLGGDTGIKTAIIKSSNYDQALREMQGTQPSFPPVKETYSCINMAFAEAYEALTNGEPVNAHLMIADEGAMNTSCAVYFLGTVAYNVPCIAIACPNLNIALFWTADGISTTEPGAS